MMSLIPNKKYTKIIRNGSIRFVMEKEEPKPADPDQSQQDQPQQVQPGEKEEPKTPDEEEGLVKDPSTGEGYKITSDKGKKRTVTYVKPATETVKKVTIQAEVKLDGKKYKVTQIAPGAFRGNTKLKKVIIGKNVQKIGKKAFYGCSNLKKITIKTTKLKTGTVGANAFKGLHEKAKAMVPAGKAKVYGKLLKKKGFKGKKQKVTE